VNDPRVGRPETWAGRASHLLVSLGRFGEWILKQHPSRSEAHDPSGIESIESGFLLIVRTARIVTAHLCLPTFQ